MGRSTVCVFCFAWKRFNNLEVAENDLKSSLDGKNKELNQSQLLISQVLYHFLSTVLNFSCLRSKRSNTSRTKYGAATLSSAEVLTFVI